MTITRQTEARYVELRTTITPELERALDRLVVTTGWSKASIVRQAVATYLAQVGVVDPSLPARTPSTLTGGRGLASTRKEHP